MAKETLVHSKHAPTNPLQPNVAISIVFDGHEIRTHVDVPGCGYPGGVRRLPGESDQALIKRGLEDAIDILGERLADAYHTIDQLQGKR